MLWVNPGDVYYSLGCAKLTHLYRSSPNPSNGYSLGLSQAWLSTRQLLNQANYFNDQMQDATNKLSAANANEAQFTAASFAMTRFGSTKIKSNLEALAQAQAPKSAGGQVPASAPLDRKSLQLPLPLAHHCSASASGSSASFSSSPSDSPSQPNSDLLWGPWSANPGSFLKELGWKPAF